MISVLLSLSLSFAAEELSEVEPAALRWSPDSTLNHRYTVHSDLTFTPSGARSFDAATSVSIDYFRPDLPFRNYDLRVTLHCGFTPMSADRHAMTCRLQDADLDSDQARQRGASEVLASMESRIEGTQVTAVLTDRGRFRDLDIQWAERGTRTWDHVSHELVLRAMSGFDLPLPDDPEARQWAQRQTAFVATATGTGPLSQAEIAHERSGGVESLTMIYSVGKLAHLALDAGGRASLVGDASLRSVALFDAANQVLAKRVWSIEDNVDSPFEHEGTLSRMD